MTLVTEKETFLCGTMVNGNDVPDPEVVNYMSRIGISVDVPSKKVLVSVSTMLKRSILTVVMIKHLKILAVSAYPW